MLKDKKVITVIVSIISAIISAVLAGCAMRLGKLSLSDFSVEIMKDYEIVTNQVQIIKENI